MGGVHGGGTASGASSAEALKLLPASQLADLYRKLRALRDETAAHDAAARAAAAHATPHAAVLAAVAAVEEGGEDGEGQRQRQQEALLHARACEAIATLDALGRSLARGGDDSRDGGVDSGSAGGLTLDGVRIVTPPAQREQMEIRMPGSAAAAASGLEALVSKVLVREVGGIDLSAQSPPLS